MFDNFRSKVDSIFFDVGKIQLMNFSRINNNNNSFCISENEHLKVIKYQNEILFEYNLIDGTINGIGICYYPFLQKTAMIGQFKNGKLNGELYVFDSNGILIEVMIYKNGKYKRHTYFWNESLSRTKKNKKKYSSNPLIDHYIIKR